MDDVNSKPILQGEYKLLKVLQKLPYSTYYLGTSLHNPGDRWAIKEIALEFDNPEEKMEAFKKFEALARKYTRLNHPIIVPLADCFYEHDYEYIVFEFVPGHRLQEILDLRKKPFTEYQVLDFANQVGQALEYLHSQRIIFHDLNPSNVIITPEGSIKLTDFGLGKVLAKRDKNQPKWGTMGYAPPEQYGANPAITESVDIFALGVIMHQMLTFWDAPLSRGVYPPVRKINPEVSEDMENLIINMLYEDPNLRYPTVGEFFKDLRKLLNVKHREEKSEEKETWLQKLVREFAKPFRK